MQAMRGVTGHDPEANWIALFCVGLLLTALAATVCLAIVAVYHPKPEQLHYVFGVFTVGSVVMLAAAARLELMNVHRTSTRRR